MPQKRPSSPLPTPTETSSPVPVMPTEKFRPIRISKRVELNANLGDYEGVRVAVEIDAYVYEVQGGQVDAVGRAVFQECVRQAEQDAKEILKNVELQTVGKSVAGQFALYLKG